MARKKHPNKEIENALKYAEELGWHIKESGGHAWGRMYCPSNYENCRCGEFGISSIWSTPKSPVNHARQIRKVVANCIAVQRQVKGE